MTVGEPLTAFIKHHNREPQATLLPFLPRGCQSRHHLWLLQANCLIELVQIPAVSGSVSCLQDGLTWQVRKAKAGETATRSSTHSLGCRDLYWAGLERCWWAKEAWSQGLGRVRHGGCGWCPAVPAPHAYSFSAARSYLHLLCLAKRSKELRGSVGWVPGEEGSSSRFFEENAQACV
jgi:hypothetical protein